MNYARTAAGARPPTGHVQAATGNGARGYSARETAQKVLQHSKRPPLYRLSTTSGTVLHHHVPRRVPRVLVCAGAYPRQSSASARRAASKACEPCARLCSMCTAVLVTGRHRPARPRPCRSRRGSRGPVVRVRCSGKGWTGPAGHERGWCVCVLGGWRAGCLPCGAAGARG